MSFIVRWTDTALRSIEKLDKITAKRIIKKIEEIKNNPFYYIKKIKGFPLYSLRVGKYRIILSIEFKKLLIFVIAVEHRKKVYKRLKNGAAGI